MACCCRPRWSGCRRCGRASMILAFSIGFRRLHVRVRFLMDQRGLHADPCTAAWLCRWRSVLRRLGELPEDISPGAGWQRAGPGVGLGVWSRTSSLNVRLPELAIPLALAGAGQSLVFAGLFRVVLTDCPPHLAGAGGGVLITIQQAVSPSGSPPSAACSWRWRQRTSRAHSPPRSACRWSSCSGPLAAARFPTSSVRQVERIRHPLALHSDAMRRQFSWSMGEGATRR